MKTRGDALVFTSCVLLAMCLSGPAAELVDGILRYHPIHSRVLFVLLSPVSLMVFFDYALGVWFAAMFSLSVLFVLFSRDVQTWKKLSLCLASLAIWPILLPWIERQKHLW